MKKETILLAILLSICLFSILAFFAVLNQKTIWEKDYQTLYMDSGSMEPALKRGDIVVVDKNVNPAELNAASKDAPNPGDIIAYYDPRYGKDPNHIIVHRAVEEYQLENGTWYFYTKGDASGGSSYDPWSPIRQDYIIGKVVDINSPSTTVNWNLWLWLTTAVAIGTGVFSIAIFVLAYSKKRRRFPSPPPTLPPVEKKQLTPSREQTRIIHCIYCGEKLPSDAIYCRKCGKKVK